MVQLSSPRHLSSWTRERNLAPYRRQGTSPPGRGAEAQRSAGVTDGRSRQPATVDRISAAEGVSVVWHRTCIFAAPGR
jgi:hypothetical protein